SETRADRAESAGLCTERGEIFRGGVPEAAPPPVGGGGPVRAELAEPRERVHRPLERLTADVLDHHVDAALARPLARLLDEVLRAVVHDLLGAERAGELDLVVGADRRDDARAAETRDLDRRAPDAAAGR